MAHLQLIMSRNNLHDRSMRAATTPGTAQPSELTLMVIRQFARSSHAEARLPIRDNVISLS